MNIHPGALEGLVIVEPQVFGDPRGFFMESYHHRRFKTAGIDYNFVQDNLSLSARGTLRGLHFQVRYPQAKFIQAVTGEIFDVAVDIRPHSPTFGKWSGVYLSEANKRQLLIAEGFAHGFCVLSETAHVAYKCSNYYHAEDEGGILWSDPAIGIEWPVNDPLVSEKDKLLPQLADLAPRQLYDPVNAS